MWEAAIQRKRLLRLWPFLFGAYGLVCCSAARAQGTTCVTGATTTVWNGPATGGDWGNASNWSAGILPSSTESACIGNGGTPSSVGIANEGVQVLNLYVDSGNSVFIANAAELDVFGASVVNAGQLVIGGSPQNSNTAVLSIRNNTTLSGGGAVFLSLAAGSGTAFLSGGSGVTLTNADNTIEGAGIIGNNGMNLVNQAGGTIDANASQGTLQLISGTVTNQGTIEATGGGTLSFQASVINAGGTIEANGAGTSAHFVNSVTISGGTLSTSTTGGDLFVDTGGNNSVTLDGATQGALTIAGKLTITDGSQATASGSIINQTTSTINITSINNDASLHIATGGVTLSGGGTINLSASGTHHAFLSGGTGAVLTNVDNTIQGVGIIGNSPLSVINESAGKIIATGGQLQLNGGLVTNGGTLGASNGGTLLVWNTINNARGTIVANSGSTVEFFNGSKIEGGTLSNINGTLEFNDSNGQGLLDGSTQGAVTNLGVLTIADGTTSQVQGSIINQGTIKINDLGSNSTLQLVGDVNLSGGGHLVLATPAVSSTATLANNGFNSSIVTLTNLDNSIEGAGQISSSGAGLLLDNQSVVNANSSGQALSITNNGVTNTGTLKATSGGILQIGTTVNNLNGSILADGVGSSVQLVGGVIQGGTLNTTNNGALGVSGGNLGTLDGSQSGIGAVTNNSVFTLADSSQLNLIGSIINNKEIDLTATTDSSVVNLQPGTTTLTGSGVIKLSGANNPFASNNVATINGPTGSQLINVNNTIEGSGVISSGGHGLVWTNEGLINANDTGQILLLTQGNSNNVITNTGTLEATMGGQLAIQQVVNNTGGVIQSSGAGSLVSLVQGTTVQGGTLSTNGSQATQISSSGNGFVGLDGATHGALVNAGGLTILNGSHAQVQGTILNQKTITVATSDTEADFSVVGNMVLSGGGTVELATTSTNGSQATINGAGGAHLLNVNNTIQGSGQISSGGFGLTFINQGTVDANLSGQTLLITRGNSGNVDINAGVMEATNGGTLVIDQTINNAGGTIQSDSSSSVQFTSSAVIQGGLLTGTIGSGTNGSSFGLDGFTHGALTLASGGTITVGGGGAANIQGSIVNQGTISVLDAGNNNTNIFVVGGANPTTLTGGGSITLSAGSTIQGGVNNGSTLINLDNTISGAGTIEEGGFGLVTVNQGTITANVSGQTLLLDQGNSSNGVTNSGLLQASNGGILAFQMPVNNANGTIQANAGSTVQFLNPTTINAGVINGSGTLTGSLTLNGGTITPGYQATLTPGVLTLNGTYAQTAGVFNAILGSTTNYSILNVSGSINLSAGALLNIAFANGFTPANGDTFTILDSTGGSLTGHFSNDTSSFVLDGFTWTLNYTGNEAILSVGPATSSNLVTAAWNPSTGNWNSSTQWNCSSGPGCVPNNTASNGYLVTLNQPGHTLTLDSSGGPITVNTLALSGGTLNIASGATLTLANQPAGITDIQQGAGLTLAGALNANDGTSVVSGLAGLTSVEGSLTLVNGQTNSTTPSDGPFTVSSTGTVNVQQGTAFAASGDMTNSGAIAIGNGASDTGSNSLSVSGTLTNRGSMALDAAHDGVVAGAVANSGAIDFNGASQSLTIANGFTNSSGGALNFNSTSSGSAATVTGALNNSGATVVLGGTGDTLTALSLFTNSGGVTVGTGETLNANGGYKNTGTTDVSGSFNAANFQQLAGTTTLHAGGVIVAANFNNAGGNTQGVGTIQGAYFLSGGSITPGMLGSNAPGAFTVNGTFTASGGTFNEIIGGASSFGLLNVSGAISLSSGTALNIALANGFVPTTGETFTFLNSTAGSLTGAFSNGSVFTMDGVQWTLSYGANAAMLTVGAPTTAATWSSGTGNWTDAAGRWSCSPTLTPCVPNNGSPNAAALYDVTLNSTGPGDTLTLDSTSFPSTVAVNTLHMTAGTLNIGSGATLNLVNQPGGITDINANSALIINGTFEIGGVATNSAIGQLSSVEGALTLANGQTTNIAPGGGTLAISSSGTVTIQGGSTLTLAGTLSNAGAVTIASGSTLNDSLNNSGTITVNGTHNVTGSFANSGAITVNSGGAMNYTVSSDAPPATIIAMNSSAINLAGGTLSLSDGGTEADTVAFSGGGTFSLVGGTITSSGSDMTFENVDNAITGNGTISNLQVINGGSIIPAGTLTITPTAGGFTNSGTVTVNSGDTLSLTGSGANMVNSGAASVNSGGSLNVAGSYSNSNTTTIVGSMTAASFANSSTGNTAISAGGTLNLGSGAFTNAGTVTLTGSGTTLSSGSFTQSAGTTNVVSGAVLLPSGTVTINGGILQGNATVGGNTAIGSGATLLAGTGPAAPGTLNFSGALIINGQLSQVALSATPGSGFGVLNATGTLTIGSGAVLDILQAAGFNPAASTTLTIADAGSVIENGSGFSVEVNGGADKFNSGTEFWQVSYNGTNIVLTAENVAAAVENATWSSGTGNWTDASGRWSCSPSAATCVPSNGTPAGTNYTATLNSLGATLTLNSTSSPTSVSVNSLTMTAGTLNIGSGATLNLTNQPGGITDINSNSGLVLAGTFELGGAPTSSGVGQLSSLEGTLTLANAQTTNVAPSAGTLTISGGTLNVQQGSTLALAGTMINSGSVALGNGASDPGGNVISASNGWTNNGSLTINGSAVTGPANAVTVTGAFSNPGTVNINSTLFGDASLSAGSITNTGGITVSGSNLIFGTLQSTGVFNNNAGGTLNVGGFSAVTVDGNLNNTSGASILGSSGSGTLAATGTFTNAGTVNTTGVTITAAAFLNSGTMSVIGGSVIGSANSLQSLADFDNNAGGSLTLGASTNGAIGGDFNNASGATLTLTGGNTVFGGGTNLGVTGTFASAGTANLGQGSTLTATNYNQTGGLTTVAGGNAFNAGATLNVTTYTQSNGTSDVQGAVSAHAYNQSGGITIVEPGSGGILGTSAGVISSTNFNQTGGSVQGGGTISGAYSMSGVGSTITPGLLATSMPGTLTISGSFSQSAGTFNELIGGSANFGILNATGAVSLSGSAALNILLVSGFTPNTGEAFTFLTGSSISGAFSNGSSFVMDGVDWTLTYSSSNVVLTAGSIGPPPPPPPPSATATWATVSGNWTTATEWSCTPGPSTCVPNNTSATVYAAVLNSPGQTLTLDNTIAVNSVAIMSGTLALNGNSLATSGDFNNSGAVTASVGSLLNVGGNLSNAHGATITIGSSGFGFGSASVSVAGTISNAGTLTMNSGGGDTLTSTGSFTNSGTTTVGSSEVLSANGGYTNIGTTDVSGTLSVTGQYSNSGATTVTGTLGASTKYLQSAGTTIVTGTLTTPLYSQTGGTTTVLNSASGFPAPGSPSTVFDQTGGAVQGQGGIVGAYSMSGPSSITPGILSSTTPGSLFITGSYAQAGGTFNELISASSFGALNVSGAANLTSSPTLNIVTGTGFVPVAGASLSFLNAGSLTGTFATATAGGASWNPNGVDFTLDNYVWNLTYTGTSANLNVVSDIASLLRVNNHLLVSDGLTSTIAAQVGTFTIGPTGDLTIQQHSTLNVNSTLNNSGNLNVTQGSTLNVGSPANPAPPPLNNSGTLGVSQGSTLSVLGTVNNSGVLTLERGSTLTLGDALNNSGTLIITSTGSGTVLINGVGGSNNFINSTGSFSVSLGSTVGINFGVKITGGNYQQELNSSLKTTQLTLATLKDAAGQIPKLLPVTALGGFGGFGTITLQNGSTLTTGTVTQYNGLVQGTGLIDVTYNMFNGVIVPGFIDTGTPGTLTLDGTFNMGGGVMAELIGPGSNGVLDVTGAATLYGSADLDILFESSFQPTAGEQFDIMNYGSLSGEFANAPGDSTFTMDGWIWNIDYDAVANGDPEIVLTADAPVPASTPEPGALLLLGTGLIALGLAGRGRVRSVFRR